MNQVMIIERDALKETLHQIQNALNKRYDISEPSNMLDMLEELSCLLGNSTLAEASAKYWLEARRKMEMDKYVAANPDAKNRLPPMLLKEYINSCCATELAAYELADSQHSSLKSKIEAIRSALSYLKAEISNINMGR